jgi:NADH:ubiquinone oxidoreductase subunit 4 (subunit M)
MLLLLKRVFFGPLNEHKHAGPIPDMKFREIAALVPLCAVIVWIGVQPKFFLDRMAPAIDELTRSAMHEVDTAGARTNPLPAEEEKQASDQKSAEIARVP